MHANTSNHSRVVLVKTQSLTACKTVYISVYILSITAILNVIWNDSANLSSFPPDKHHDLDAVYWMGGEQFRSDCPKTLHIFRKEI